MHLQKDISKRLGQHAIISLIEKKIRNTQFNFKFILKTKETKKCSKQFQPIIRNQMKGKYTIKIGKGKTIKKQQKHASCKAVTRKGPL